MPDITPEGIIYEQGRRQSSGGYQTKEPVDNEFEKAKTAFYIDDIDFSTVTRSQLDSIYRGLQKQFHPDQNDDPRSTGYSQKINQYYQILLKHLKN